MLASVPALSSLSRLRALSQPFASNTLGISVFVFPSLMAAAQPAGAANNARGANVAQNSANMSEMGLCNFFPCGGSTTMIRVIQGLMEFLALGIIFLSVLGIIIGGLYYIFSAGDEGGAERGKSIIVASVIGLAVVFLSYLIVKLMQALAWGLNTGGA